jgi:hypothetical protein
MKVRQRCAGGEDGMLEKKDKCVDIFIRVFIGMRPLATAGGTVIAVYGYGSAWPQLTHNIFCKKSLPHRSSHCDFTHLFSAEGSGCGDSQSISPSASWGSGARRRIHLGFSHLGGRIHMSIGRRDEKNDCGRKRLNHVCGRLGLCLHPLRCILLWGWMSEDLRGW